MAGKKTRAFISRGSAPEREQHGRGDHSARYPVLPPTSNAAMVLLCWDMRAFAAAWPERSIVQHTVAQLSWRQNIALLEKLRSSGDRLWYAAKPSWSRAWSRIFRSYCWNCDRRRNMLLELDSLNKAAAALNGVLAKSNNAELMRGLEVNISYTAADGVTRRELFRLAAENRLIVDVDKWMRHQDARNQTSHTFDPAVAESVYAAAHGFARDAQRLLEALETRND